MSAYGVRGSVVDEVVRTLGESGWATRPSHTNTVEVSSVLVMPDGTKVQLVGKIVYALTAQDRARAALSALEENERAGLPRENFGSRFSVDGATFDRLQDAWDEAWDRVSGPLVERLFAHLPPSCPATIEGANRLLEKRRLAVNPTLAPVVIQEWVEGEWLPALPEEAVFTLADKMIARLNELVALDRIAMTSLVDTRFPCDPKFATHPTVQVLENDGDYYVGFLGVLNALVGARPKDGWGYIAVELDDIGNVVRFIRTP